MSTTAFETLSRTTSRRTLLAAAAAAGLGAAGLAGCTTRTGTPTSGGGDGGGEDQALTYWSFDDGRVAIAKHVAESSAFTSSHPGVKLSIQRFPWAQMHDKLLAALVSGRGAPDMADIEIQRFSQFIGGNEVPLVDLTDRLGADREQLVTGAATAPWTWKDRIYGIGTELNAVTLGYRQDIMDDNNISTPFKSWDDIIASGQKISAQGKTKMFPVHDRSIWDFLMVQQLWGGSFFENGEYAGDSDSGVAALTWLHDLLYEYKIASIAPSTAANTYNGPEFWAAFGNNEYAALFGPPWMFTGLLKTVPALAGKWRMQEIPPGLGDSAPTALIGGTGQTITNQSKKANVCWDLIKLTNLSLDSSRFEFETRAVYPTYKEALTQDWLKEPVKYFGNQRIGDVYAKVAPEVPEWQVGPSLYPAIDTTVRVALTPVINNKADPATALRAVRQEIPK